MFISKKNSGFSLVELLVSLSLMLLLVGAAIVIFLNSSTVLISSEQRIAIFQNARAAFSLISKDISNATTGEGLDFVLRNPTKNNDPDRLDEINNLELNPDILLEFITITSWLDPDPNIDSDKSGIITGKACVYYYLNKSGTRWSLKRLLVDLKVLDEDPAPNNLDNLANITSIENINLPLRDPTSPLKKRSKNVLTNDVVCQFIDVFANDLQAITINYFFYDNVLSIRTPKKIIFDNSDQEHKLPVAIRVIMDITDGKAQAVRTIAQTIWLVNSESD